MATDWYSPEQVADQLGLHVRTVRNYVRDGRLKAVRIGKQYRISRADLEALTGGPAEVAAHTRHVEVSSIIDVDGIAPDDAQRLAALLTGLPTGPPGAGRARLEVVHEPGRSRLKVIVVGGVDAAVELVRLVGSMVEEGT